MGRRVLVVEDESLVALLLEDMLLELGFTVVDVASRLETGMSAAQQAAFDVAVLDVNLGGETRSFPIADLLRRRGIPFVFATGHDPSSLERSYPDAPVVRKPFLRGDLRSALARALAG
ncbi:response regulator [Geminicoccus flavidas]|uniref:response regulator n=1 Tax=Geminicoccus flavidas TaxID=2506407 RepID=UPI00135AE01A|nr:response regulator [Geminicoccus flavidas]